MLAEITGGSWSGVLGWDFTRGDFARHNLGANYAFLDGHVAWMRFQGWAPVSQMWRPPY